MRSAYSDTLILPDNRAAHEKSLSNATNCGFIARERTECPSHLIYPRATFRSQTHDEQDFGLAGTMHFIVQLDVLMRRG